MISKELFIETMLQLKLQESRDDQIVTALGIVFPDAFEANLFPDNSILTNQLIKILQIQTNDTEDSWIEYFIYDLDYGNDYKPGCVTLGDGSSIDLSDIESLYNFLKEEYSNE